MIGKETAEDGGKLGYYIFLELATPQGFIIKEKSVINTLKRK